MVLLEKQPKLLLVLVIFSLIFLVSACSVSDITGRAIDRNYQVVELLPPGFECEQDIDCGTDSFMGASFCKDGDVYGRYKEYMCLSTLYSSDCRDKIYDKLIENCDEERGDVCVSGVSYCVKGLQDRELDIEIINDCSKDSDCGTDGLINREFCDRGDLYDYYETNSCESGICEVEREKKLIEDCGDGFCDEQKGECSGIPPGQECLTANDCKSDGLYGEPVCRGETVMKRSRTSICQKDCQYTITYVKIDFCEGVPCVPGKGCVQKINLVNETNITQDTQLPGNVTQNVSSNVSSNISFNVSVNQSINVTSNVSVNFTNVSINESVNVTSNFSVNLTNISVNQSINATNITINETQAENGGSEHNGEDTPFEPVQTKAVGSECTIAPDCGSSGFSGQAYCSDSSDNEIYSTYVSFECVNGYCIKNVENQLVQKCSNTEYCAQGKYSCQKKIVDSAIGKILIVPANPKINQRVDFYFAITNLGYVDTVYGLEYELMDQEGEVNKLDTPINFKLGGYESKTVYIASKTFTKPGNYNLRLNLLSSSEEEYTLENNQGEMIITVTDPTHCSKYNFLGICVEN